MSATLIPRGTTDRVMSRMFPKDDPYMNRPNDWVADRLHEHLWSKQQEIGDSVVEHRYTAVPSCHDTGKSYRASRLAAWWLETRPVGEAFVVTSAPTQPQVEAILWREIEKAHRKGGLRGRITGDAKWKIGNELVAYGRKPADYTDVEQAMQAFQGIHALHVLVILDEACGIPKWLFDAADSLATNERARVVAIGNPDDPTSHFADVCRPGSGWNVIPIGWEDTPAFTGEEVPDELLELLISKTWVDERAHRWGIDSALYQSKVKGLFPDVSDDSLITPRMVLRGHMADLAGIAQGAYGADIARHGDAETVLYRDRGGVIRLTFASRKQDTEETADQISGVLAGHGPDQLPAYVDADGLGIGVVDKLRRPVDGRHPLNILEFHGGQAANDPERFANRRAEVFWILREDLDNGLVDLDPEDDVLAAQLQKIRWKLDSRGRIQIESKEDMRKRGVPSPDRADGVAMAHACPTGRLLAELMEQLQTRVHETQLVYSHDILERAM